MSTENTENRIVVITGPTAVGKTRVSVQLAKTLGTEIISADSMQVYRGMDIGTAKVTEEEKEGIPHHLIDIRNPEEDWDVTRFQDLSRKEADKLQKNGKIPIVCGGTGFYIQALLYDTDFCEEGEPDGLRDELFTYARENGNEALHEMLRETDPVSYAKIPANNVKRVVRAIEFQRIHGIPISRHNEEESRKKEKSIYDARLFVLYDERAALFERINRRVDAMIRDGLLEEAEKIYRLGLRENCNAMLAIGYRELWPYFQGACSLPEAVEKIKLDSRHYAKKQLTWWKKDKNAIWINVSEGDPTDEIIRHLW